MGRWNRAHAAAALCLLVLGSASAKAREPWIVLKDCRLEPNQSNDADSFHVTSGGKSYIFRLYFADAPETDASFPERIAEQAKYFGLSAPQTVQLGKLAQKFTQEKLVRPFTVRTCKQDALGRSKKERFYAFVGTTEGDLAELLVSNGLARVHGRGAAPVGLNSQGEWQKLQALERQAKAQKVGGWGAATGRMSARVPAQSSQGGGASSFDAFFHPERLASPAPVTAAVTPTPAPILPAPRTVPVAQTTAAHSTEAAPTGKLDVNSAAISELMNIKGIGPVLAQRIIEARPLKSADELRNVKGIGPKTYEKIRPFFL